MRITILSLILFFASTPDSLAPTHGYFNVQRYMNSFSENLLSVTLHLKETVADYLTAFIED